MYIKLHKVLMTMNNLHLKQNSSGKCYGKHRRMNSVDFVLAYNRRKNRSTIRKENIKLDEEEERKQFYRELRSHGISINVDDDPLVSTIISGINETDY